MLPKEFFYVIFHKTSFILSQNFLLFRRPSVVGSRSSEKKYLVKFE